MTEEIQNPDLLLVFLGFVLAPMVFVAVVAMLRNYHVWLHIYRGDKQMHTEESEEK